MKPEPFNFLARLQTALGLGQKRCAHCLRPFSPQSGHEADFYPSPRICPQCLKALAPYSGPRCSRCGVPTGAGAGFEAMGMPARKPLICPGCEKTPPPWHGHAYHGLYTGALRDLILRLKFDAELHLSHFFAELLLEASKCLPMPDAVLAVPQHPSQLRRRGFNQAHELARNLARLGKFRLAPALLRRIRKGAPQESLDALQRRSNLRGAFKASPKARGLKIWLVDDVMTTGSTCVEATKALLAENAKHVCLLFIARTPFQ